MVEFSHVYRVNFLGVAVKLMRIFFVFFGLIGFVYGLGENIKTFKSDFVQTIKSDNGQKVVYKGKFEAKVPSFAKWTYTKPLEKEIYVDGENVVVYEPNLSQATMSHLKEKADFISILKKATLSSDGKYYSRVGNTLYELTLKDKKPYMLEFVDEFGNQIQMKFNNALVNVPVDEKDFVFVPAPDTDIIHQ